MWSASQHDGRLFAEFMPCEGPFTNQVMALAADGTVVPLFPPPPARSDGVPWGSGVSSWTVARP